MKAIKCFLAVALMMVILGSVGYAATMGETNALKSADSYLEYSDFSYKGLIEQLEYEGYSNAEATYAADNCGANWEKEALDSAKSYLEYSAFSYSGLIEQLEYEGFTNTEAKYAADNCNADWKEQAAKSAKSYLEYSSFSQSGLIEQLEYEGFTHEQAVYGVNQNGYASSNDIQSETGSEDEENLNEIDPFFVNVLTDNGLTIDTWCVLDINREYFVACTYLDCLLTWNEKEKEIVTHALQNNTVYMVRDAELLYAYLFGKEEIIMFAYSPENKTAYYTTTEATNASTLATVILEGLKDEGIITSYWSVNNAAIIKTIQGLLD